MKISLAWLLLAGLPALANAEAEKSEPAAHFRGNLDLADVPTAGPEEAQQLAHQALTAFRKNDLSGAQRLFESALRIAPENPAINVNLGLIAYRQKHYAEAEQRLQQVTRVDPNSGLAWLVLGIAYYDEEKLDRALAALAQAVVLEPKDARAHHYLGVTIGRKGWYLGAEEEMRKAIELQPDYSEAHYNLAVFYLQRTPPAIELARRHYQRALDLGAPPDPQMAKTLGE